MKSVLLFSVLLLPSQNEQHEFVVKLKDGTTFRSKIKESALEVKTEYGMLKIPWKDVKHIKKAKGGFSIKTKSAVVGSFGDKMAFDTKYGRFNIDTENIVEMIPASKKIFTDNNVTGFWDFSSEEDVKLNGGKFGTEDDKTVAEQRLAGDGFNTIEIPSNDSHNGKDQLTVEVKFKYSEKGLGGGWINMIRKGHSNYNANFEIWMNPSGKQFQIGCWGKNGQFVYTNCPNAKLQPDTWHHFAFVVDCKNKKMTIYLNGEEVKGTSSVALEDELKSSDAPIFLFKKEDSGTTDTMWVDFVRISNKARSEEEIKELIESGTMMGSLKQSADKEFNVIILTKDGERYACKVPDGKIPFECDLGNVQVDITTVSRIDFFEYRRTQIEKIHTEARELIKKLGSDDPEQREKAHGALEKMGWIIIPVLEENIENKDEEIKTRVKTILEKYSNKKYEIKKDVIEGNGLYLRGWFKPETIKITTRYGPIEVEAKYILFIISNSAENSAPGKIIIHLTDGSRLSGKLKIEEIGLKTDFGDLKVNVKDVIRITFGKMEDTIVTKKSTLKGTITRNEFELDSQIGVIKIKKDSISQITTSSTMIKDGNVLNGASVTGASNGHYVVNGNFDRYQYGYAAVMNSMTIELKESYLLSAIGIYFYSESDYKFRYYVQVSNDNKNWIKVIDKEDKDSSGWQLDRFSATPVRYIKITGTKSGYGGGTSDTNFYIVEVEGYCNSDNIRTPSLTGIGLDLLKELEKHQH